MSPETIVDALLRVPTVTAVVATGSIALEQLAQGAADPAIVYRTITTTPAVYAVGATASAYRSRVQINPLAASVAQVLAVAALVRAAIESDAERTVAGRRLISARWDSLGPFTKDDFTGLWTQPADFILLHE